MLMVSCLTGPLGYVTLVSPRKTILLQAKGVDIMWSSIQWLCQFIHTPLVEDFPKILQASNGFETESYFV